MCLSGRQLARVVKTLSACWQRAGAGAGRRMRQTMISPRQVGRELCRACSAKASAIQRGCCCRATGTCHWFLQCLTGWLSISCTVPVHTCVKLVEQVASAEPHSAQQSSQLPRGACEPSNTAFSAEALSLAMLRRALSSTCQAAWQLSELLCIPLSEPSDDSDCGPFTEGQGTLTACLCCAEPRPARARQRSSRPSSQHWQRT